MSNWFFLEIFAYGLFAIMGATTIVWGVKKMLEMALDIKEMLKRLKKEK